MAPAVQGHRIVKRSGYMLFFCDWRMVQHLGPAIESTGARYQNLIVWDKVGFGMGTGFHPQHELIMHFTLGAPEWHDQTKGNILRCSRVHHSDKSHATEKPVDLMQALIRVVAPPGGTILDPFTGSGSTGCAAVRGGWSFIGIEREAEYVATARARIGREAAQGVMMW